jgi:hypothetical protein
MPEDGSPDVFVHISAVEEAGWRDLVVIPGRMHSASLRRRAVTDYKWRR